MRASFAIRPRQGGKMSDMGILATYRSKIPQDRGAPLPRLKPPFANTIPSTECSLYSSTLDAEGFVFHGHKVAHLSLTNDHEVPSSGGRRRTQLRSGLFGREQLGPVLPTAAPSLGSPYRSRAPCACEVLMVCRSISNQKATTKDTISTATHDPQFNPSHHVRGLAGDRCGFCAFRHYLRPPKNSNAA